MSDTRKVVVGEKGRIVVPAFAREQLGWEQGTELRLVIREDSIELLTMDALINRLSGWALQPGAEPYSVDEFIAEKRLEAAREDAEMMDE